MQATYLNNKIAVAALLLLTTLVFFTSLARESKAEITVAATLSSTTFSVDEGAQLTITVHGTRSAELQIPATGKFDIYQRGRSSQINMINGNFSSSITITCILQAYKPGHYTIPPMTIRADKTTLKTDTLPFEVTATSQPRTGSGTAVSPPTDGSGSDDKAAYITLLHAKEKSYVGEIIPVEIKAYFRQGLRANLNSAPALVGDGLVMPQLHDQPRQTQEKRGGATYSVLSWQTTLSNIKEGTHTIHLELEATQLIPQRRTSTSLFGRRSPFDDDLFDSVFGGYKQKPLKVVSEDITLEILPLPEEGQPGSFTGAIGNFSLQARVEPQQAETGEPLTLRMTVRGAGNFDRVEAPLFPDSADWKTYSPSSNFTAQDNNNSSGEKVFEQAIVAKSPTLTEIPALSFSYFDPKKGVYRTSSSQPIPITITGKAAAPPATVAHVNPQSQQQQAPPGIEAIAGLAPLQLKAGKPTDTILPLYRKPLFLSLMALCLITLMVLSGRRVQHVRALGKPEDRQKRQLSTTLQHSLAAVEKELVAENSAAFLAACRTTIQTHLGTLWKCEPSAITRADLTSKLADSPELLDIFTAAEQAAYSGALLSREAMEQSALTLKTELEKLI